MPIYEYACSNCGKVSDVLQKMSDPAPEKCEHCGAEGTLTRVVSRTTFVLKGGGWYSDLYGSSKKDGSGSKDSAPKDSAAKDSAAKDAPKKESASKEPASKDSSTSTSASGSAASTTTSSAPKTKAANE
jgi:putative FmdB family regulatory protein